MSEGAGARRLGEARTRAAIQLLLVQACGEIFHVHGRRLAADAITGILDVVKSLADHARQADRDMTLRCQLAAAQAHDKVCPLHPASPQPDPATTPKGALTPLAT